MTFYCQCRVSKIRVVSTLRAQRFKAIRTDNKFDVNWGKRRFKMMLQNGIVDKNFSSIYNVMVTNHEVFFVKSPEKRFSKDTKTHISCFQYTEGWAQRKLFGFSKQPCIPFFPFKCFLIVIGRYLAWKWNKQMRAGLVSNNINNSNF